MTIIPQLIANSLIAGALYSLTALGFNLIYGATKFFNFAYGATAVWGAYAVFFFYKILELNLFLSVVLGLLVAGILGFIFDKLIFLPLRKRKAKNLVLLVASIGLFSALQALLAIIFTSQFKTLSKGGGVSQIYNIFSASVSETQVIIILSAVLAHIGLILFLKKTKFGKASRAVSDNEEAAKISGINTNKIISQLFFIGSLIAGAVGILIGFDTGTEPTSGLNLLLKGVIAAIIGGAANIYGGILGAFLLGFSENFGIWKISGEWKDAIAFAILILFLLFRPQGILKKF